jgi:hypothetical protein
MRLILFRTSYRLDYPDLAKLDSWRYKTVFSMPSTLYVVSTQPLIEGAPGTLSSGVRRPKREAGHSPPPSVEHMNV